MNAIDISGLRVRYGALEAVRGIDLHVPQGALFAFLGPNGAGKSTTLSVLSTLLAPSAGSVFVAGHALGREDDAIRRAIGIVFQQSVLDDLLTVEENLRVGQTLGAGYINAITIVDKSVHEINYGFHFFGHDICH